MYFLRYVHYQGLLRQSEGYYAKYKTAFFEENDYSVLFLGSSRAEMHYDMYLFDSITHQNSFNLSLRGATPRVAFAVLKAYLLNSKTPEYLFYEIDIHSLNDNTNEIVNFNNYFCFFSNKTLREEFNKIDDRMIHFYYNPYYSFPFTGVENISTSMHGWFKIPNRTDSLYYKGFVKELLSPNLIFDSVKKFHVLFNVSKRNYLDSIISICKEKNIQLTLITSPIFGGGQVDLLNKAQIIRQLHNIAKINSVNYYDMSSLPFCDNRNLFVDHHHLNYNGAKKYSHYVANLFNNKIVIPPLK